MGTTNEILRYVGGTAGPAGDGWVVVLNGDLWVDKTAVAPQSMLGNLSLPQLSATVASGTPPLIVTSPTLVTNFNADLLDGQHGSYYQNATNLNAGTVANARLPTAISQTTLTASGAVTGSTLASTVATGTAPLTVASTTKVVNLNADLLDDLSSSSFVRTDAPSTMLGQLTIGPFGGTTAGLVLPESTGATNRSSLIIGGWELGQDSLGNGARDFYLYNGATGRVLGVAADGTFYIDKNTVIAHGAAIYSPSTPATGSVNDVAFVARDGNNDVILRGRRAAFLQSANGAYATYLAETGEWVASHGHGDRPSSVLTNYANGLATWGQQQLVVRSAVAGIYGWAGISFHPANAGIAPILGCGNGFGERLCVRSNPNNAWVPIAASAFEVNSTADSKTNIRRKTPHSRKNTRDRLRRLRTVEFDNAVPPQALRVKPEHASLPSEELRPEHYELHDHDCAIDQCGGTADRPCGLWRAGRNRRSIVLEDLAEQFPNICVSDADDNLIAYDLAGLVAELMDMVLDMDAQLQVLQGA